MDDEIIDLQSRLAFQEMHIEALTKTINQQQNAIQQLQKQMQLMYQRLNSLHEQMDFNSIDSPPPHY